MILSRAPLRISLGGGGTDLASYYGQHGGFVLSAAIDKYVYIYVNRPAADNLLRVKYSRYEEVADPDEIEHDLVRPALKVMGIVSNVEIASLADVPAGTGLGSSAAYLVGVLIALQELKRERIPRQALAELAAHIEIELAGHPAGKHDHYLATFGGITCLEISPAGEVRVSPLSISGASVRGLRESCLLFFTGVRRNADDVLRAQKTQTEAGDPIVLDSLHRTKEIGYRVRDALERGDLDDFGHLLHEHWMNKRRRSDAISEPRFDRWYAQAREAGALGGKIVGAGGGGFLMLYCPPASREPVRDLMQSEGLHEMRYDFDYDGAKVLIVQ